MRPCLEPGCPTLVAGTRCAEHRRARELERGTPTARGYDAAHRAMRRGLQRLMDRGAAFTCWRCGKPIDPTNWTLGHCDDDRTRYHGPECPPCDYATAGRASRRCPHPEHEG